MYSELMDFVCPRCKTMRLIVSYLTVDEMREYAAAGSEKAIREIAAAELQRARRPRPLHGITAARADG
jgi:hypothetical protein